jgi:hypothetical protein
MIFLKNKKNFAKNNLRLIRQIQSIELEEKEMSWLLNTQLGKATKSKRVLFYIDKFLSN